MEKKHAEYNDGTSIKRKDTVDINFVCRSFEGTLKEQEEEVGQLQFFAEGKLPINLSGNDKEIIEAIWKNEKEK